MSYHTSEEDVQRLFKVASATKEYSYSPYSKFRVGAAVLCRDGTIVGGTNIENCSYPNGLCAERAAISSCISQGHKDIVAILVTSDIKDDFITPCGFCRQFIVEFGNLEVILTKATGEAKRMHITDILPMAFSPADLTK
ncbi:cytidine deaminase [Histomonas meleagridis]|uniref:cytidine deaminase n=1 Tax=Histomonas meleagridis TaxID=135588 RepID=UPI00355AC691|nr:cytidine deaminase [Histomonas meleagridis]KAH0802307.1 cytidine deaminase [Histomonas meleagridis]